MFTSLRLKQFKPWTDTGSITLAPVTLVLGTNSSGKSSLIQSLLLLKRAVESPDRTIYLNLGGDDATDLFNYGCLPDTLAPVIHGKKDRKMVTACLAALVTHGPCLIAFAGDGDWIGWERVLCQHGVELEPIIEDWARWKYAEKQSNKGASKNCHFPGRGKLAGPYETFSRTDFLKMRRQAHWRALLNFSRCPQEE